MALEIVTWLSHFPVLHSGFTELLFKVMKWHVHMIFTFMLVTACKRNAIGLYIKFYPVYVTLSELYTCNILHETISLYAYVRLVICS